jgi:hypothetical protein
MQTLVFGVKYGNRRHSGGVVIKALILETIVCTFEITKPFQTWKDKFDTEKAAARAKGIKVIYRGVSKDNPAKIFVIVQAKGGVIPLHIQENSATFTTIGALMETAIAMSYVAG